MVEELITRFNIKLKNILAIKATNLFRYNVLFHISLWEAPHSVDTLMMPMSLVVEVV